MQLDQPSFDKYAVAVIRDEDLKKPIGTAFVFIQPNWLVTAKHVVMDYGVARPNLELVFADNYRCPVQVAFAHPSVDLAVLAIKYRLCERPFFPGHHSLAKSRPLSFAGYSPNQPAEEGDRVVIFGDIPRFDTELRTRSDGEEEVILFEGYSTEGGCSGGPVLTAEGNVVGVIIENSMGPNGPISKATSILPLVDRLEFRCIAAANPTIR